MKDVALLRKRNLKAWVSVDEEVSILARYISQAEWEELKAQCTETILNPITNQTDIKEDMPAFRALLGERVVSDIVGLVDSEDLDDSGNVKPFPATPANIAMLMEEWTEFRLTVMGVPMSFERMLDLAKAQTTKN